jgi:hypothetical protein
MRVILHIGYPRTASTSIQDGIFSGEDYFFSIGKPRNDIALVNFSNKLRKISFIKDQNNSDLKKELINICKKNKKIVVFSDETIITRANAYEIILFFKDVFSQVEVLLTIRSQLTLIQSFYEYKGKILKDVPNPYRFNKVKFNDFYYYYRQHNNNNIINSLDYYNIVKTLKKILGEDKVHILCFEEFVNNRNSWSKKMSKILHINSGDIYNWSQVYSNKPKSHGDNEYKRIINKGLFHRFIAYIPISLRRSLGRCVRYFLKSEKLYKVKITQQMKEEIINDYKIGNRALMKEYGVNLEKYNYPL